ncbi:MAG: SHOCT domain-containing protein, partial [Clostridia bacterium]|nr:SHOCT domain-containing protein [Clostridia bacterium]
RIEVLNDLKEQGILTEDEYNQKRSDIVKDLKF